MEIKCIHISGLIPALRALRLPYGKEPRSMRNSSGIEIIEYATSYDASYSVNVSINKDDLTLLKRLILAGDQHAKVMRGVVAYIQIDAPIYWWRELETYRIGHERLSCESTMHIDCKGLSGEELQQAKADMPMGKVQRAIDMFSYQALRRIYFQRRDHRLPEWREFCKFIETLPFADQLITIQRNETISQENHSDTR